MENEEFKRNLELVALGTALQKQVKAKLDELRLDADAELLKMHEESGVDSLRLTINGESVGKMGVRIGKARIDINPSKEGEALNWLAERGLAEFKPVKDWNRQLAFENGHAVDLGTGEASPAGLFVEHPGCASVAVYGCKPEDVKKACRGELPQAQVMELAR